MAAKHALVVDDSRVAQVSLRKMLEEHRVTVDTAESGEDALKFLRHNMPPAVIFMDHMMPGMDGFEALQAIKRDPNIASVPVVMYTSKEGEAYMGQAKALGASAVLSKPIRPIQLVKILEQLNLVEAQTTEGARIDVARNDAIRHDPARESGAPSELREAAYSAAEAVNQSPLAQLLRRLFDEQRTALQQDLASAVANGPRTDGAPRWQRLAPLAAIVMVLAIPAIWAWALYRDARAERDELRSELSQLKEVQRAAPSAISPDLVASLERQQRKALQDNAVLIDALVWSLNTNGEYEYDQPPLNDERLHIVRELIARLTQTEFHGTVRLETHVGEFCLTRTDAGTWRMPNDDAPIARCDIVSYAPEQAVNLGKRQSIAFARFLSGSALANAGVRVEIASYGKDRPLLHYPAVGTLQTAGEWNKIARRNNRVEIAIIATP